MVKAAFDFGWRWRLRLQWEVLKEAWPYIRRHPFRETARWWALYKTRKTRRQHLEASAFLGGLTRKIGENDSQLAKRLEASRHAQH